MTDARNDTTDLALGLEPTHRFRCTGCANLTRFDVVASERTRRFHHLELGGEGRIEDEEVLDRTVESVTCRWCGRDDTIAVEPVAREDVEPVAREDVEPVAREDVEPVAREDVEPGASEEG